MTISIITVTLNDLVNLKITYASLLEQSYKDFEWIIKDGGSKDESENFYRTEIQLSGLKTRFICEKDRSIYDAMNQAIKYANNQYILFLNAGDCIADSETLKKVNESIIARNDDFCFIYGDNIDITPEGLPIYKKARELSYLCNSLPTSHQAIFYEKIVLNKYKYSLDYIVASDYALTAQIYFDGNRKYLKLDFPISKFSLGGLSSSRRDILLKEGYKIHRNIVKDNIIKAKLKIVKRFITFVILDKHPDIYIMLRRIFK